MEWRDIKGYEGLYQISDTGLVRSLNRYTTGKRHRLLKGVLLKQYTISNGYYFGVDLSKNGEVERHRVHRLVADAFIPNPNNYSIINHIDLNGKNNNVENLEWCTQSWNIKHANLNGHRTGKTKLTKEQVAYIKDVFVPYDKEFGVSALSRKFNVYHATVKKALHRNYL